MLGKPARLAYRFWGVVGHHPKREHRRGPILQRNLHTLAVGLSSHVSAAQHIMRTLFPKIKNEDA